MAITKILPVRGQLKGCLDYAANPQKTEYFSTADMQRLISYTQNKDKTEHQLYVSGFNCMHREIFDWIRLVHASARTPCGVTSKSCVNFHLQCSKNTSGK